MFLWGQQPAHGFCEVLGSQLWFFLEETQWG